MSRALERAPDSLVATIPVGQSPDATPPMSAWAASTSSEARSRSGGFGKRSAGSAARFACEKNE